MDKREMKGLYKGCLYFERGKNHYIRNVVISVEIH